MTIQLALTLPGGVALGAFEAGALAALVVAVGDLCEGDEPQVRCARAVQRGSGPQQDSVFEGESATKKPAAASGSDWYRRSAATADQAGAEQDHRPALWQDCVRLDDGFWKSLASTPCLSARTRSGSVGAKIVAVGEVQKKRRQSSPPTPAR